MTASVPVLLITGPVGVGKSTVAAEAARLLREANVPHALVDLAWIEQCWPVPADDPWNERLTHRNLACMWANFRQAGAGRLLLVRVLEARSLLRQVAEAVPGAEVTVVRLRASLAVLQARIRSREASDPSWFLGAAIHTAKVLEQAQVEDHLVDNEDRPWRWSPRKCSVGPDGSTRVQEPSWPGVPRHLGAKVVCKPVGCQNGVRAL
jgi:DNA polymerase III delta prime subunit